MQDHGYGGVIFLLIIPHLFIFSCEKPYVTPFLTAPVGVPKSSRVHPRALYVDWGATQIIQVYQGELQVECVYTRSLGCIRVIGTFCLGC